MKNKRNVFGVIILVLVAGIMLMSGKPAAKSPENATEETSVAMAASAPAAGDDTAAPAAPATPKLDSSLLDNAPLRNDFMLGNPEAPITIIEYASMSCPHCAHFHNKVMPILTKNYIDTGKVRYILRQFPLNEPALAGAILVTCAGDMGGPARYYTFARVLFDAQNKWAFDDKFKDSLKTFAEVGGINGQAFDVCMKDIKLEKRILEIRKEASESLQIDSTPYIFINGHPHKGNKSLEAVTAEIDAMLRSPK